MYIYKDKTAQADMGVCTPTALSACKRAILEKVLGYNNILFIQISPAKHVHTKFIEDLNERILLIEFISSKGT